LHRNLPDVPRPRNTSKPPITLYERPDSRYRILYDDARAYLTHTDQRYDVIATDCTDLRYKSNANLYDLSISKLAGGG